MKTIKIVDDNSIKTSELYKRIKDKFGAWSYWNEEGLDDNFPVPKETTTRYFTEQAESSDGKSDGSSPGIGARLAISPEPSSLSPSKLSQTEIKEWIKDLNTHITTGKNMIEEGTRMVEKAEKRLEFLTVKSKYMFKVDLPEDKPIWQHTMPSKDTPQNLENKTLEDVLDEQFPKGECKNRGNALVLYAYAQLLMKNAIQKEREEIVRMCEGMKVANGNYNCGEEGCCPKPKNEIEKEDFEIQIGFNNALSQVVERIKNRE